MRSRDAYDEFESIEFSELAGRQLAEISNSDSALYGRILKDIQLHLTAWSPGDEDGNIIKHAARVSRACAQRVYRLKSPPTIQKWRVFFTFLDGRTPPVRLVMAFVEWMNNEQCYDDMSQPHIGEIRRCVLEAGMKGDYKRRRR